MSEEDKKSYNINQIDSILNTSKIYKEKDDIFIFSRTYLESIEKNEQKDEETEYEKYFAKINLSSSEYIGYLSQNLKKMVFGCNKYSNGDIYLGQWDKNKKDGYGIYYFNNQKDLYIGEFYNNLRSGDGLIFNNDEQNLICSVGRFVEDNFVDGKIFINNGNYLLYFGKIKNNKKNDENGILIRNWNEIFKGRIIDDQIIEGRMIKVEGSNISCFNFYKEKQVKDRIENDYFEYTINEEEDNGLINYMNELKEKFEILELKKILNFANEQKNLINDFEQIQNIDYENNIKNKLKELYDKILY